MTTFNAQVLELAGECAKEWLPPAMQGSEEGTVCLNGAYLCSRRAREDWMGHLQRAMAAVKRVYALPPRHRERGPVWVVARSAAKAAARIASYVVDGTTPLSGYADAVERAAEEDCKANT